MWKRLNFLIISILRSNPVKPRQWIPCIASCWKWVHRILQKREFQKKAPTGNRFTQVALWAWTKMIGTKSRKTQGVDATTRPFWQIVSAMLSIFGGPVLLR